MDPKSRHNRPRFPNTEIFIQHKEVWDKSRALKGNHAGAAATVTEGEEGYKQALRKIEDIAGRSVESRVCVKNKVRRIREGLLLGECQWK